MSKTTTSHVHLTFLFISFPFLHDYDVKMPNFAFYRGRKQATTKFYFSFRAWIWSLENSASGGFAYISQSKWSGIIAKKTERTQIHFLSDVLVAVASLDLKVLIVGQQLPRLVDVACCVRLHTLLHVVGNCSAKFKIGQTFEPTTPNNSFVPLSPKRSTTIRSSSNNDGNGYENVI